MIDGVEQAAVVVILAIVTVAAMGWVEQYIDRLFERPRPKEIEMPRPRPAELDHAIYIDIDGRKATVGEERDGNVGLRMGVMRASIGPTSAKQLRDWLNDYLTRQKST